MPLSLLNSDKIPHDGTPHDAPSPRSSKYFALIASALLEMPLHNEVGEL